MISRELLKPIGGQPVEADQPAVDARCKMRGTAHVPGQGTGAVAPVSQVRTQGL
jgi:hypothetical protein